MTKNELPDDVLAVFMSTMKPQPLMLPRLGVRLLKDDPRFGADAQMIDGTHVEISSTDSVLRVDDVRVFLPVTGIQMTPKHDLIQYDKGVYLQTPYNKVQSLSAPLRGAETGSETQP